MAFPGSFGPNVGAGTREITTGRSLTAFRRVRRRLPLPQERVKSRRAFQDEGALRKGLLKGEGARAAISSISDYVVNWWVLALAAIAGEKVREVAWV